MRPRALVSLAALLLLVGCEAPDLPRHFVINDASWGPSAPARVRLAPGDVLYLSTWIHGSVTPIPNNDYPPIISTERLPLRVVDGPLLPLEFGLLGSVLATHRTNVVATPVLAKALDREQAALWDALVTSLRLVKASPRVPMQVQLDEGQFCRAFAGTKPGPVRTLILTSYFRYADGTCTAVGTTDLRKIPQLETALAPLTETNTGMHGGFIGTATRPLRCRAWRRRSPAPRCATGVEWKRDGRLPSGRRRASARMATGRTWRSPISN